MGVQTFSSFATCWTRSCDHTVENDDVAQTLGCNLLSSLIQGRHDETAENLHEFVGRLRFTSRPKGRYRRTGNYSSTLLFISCF
jgi:hypothetical protein